MKEWGNFDERKTLIEQTTPHTIFVDSDYWRFVKQDTGIAFTDMYSTVPPRDEVELLFFEIMSFYDYIETEYGSIDEFNAERLEQREKEEQQRRAAYGSSHEKRKRSDDGYVYLIQSEMGQYKIGKSRQLDKRIKLFSVKLPFKTEMIHYFYTKTMTQDETFLHDRFSEKRTNGEWFDLTTEDVEYIKSFDFSESDK